MKYFSPGLLDGSVTTAKLADGSVTTLKLADLAVATAKIDNNAVTLAKISNGQVNRDKLRTQATELAGTITTKTFVDLILTRDCFFPMIHVSDPEFVHVAGHSVDGSTSNNPRISLYNDAVSAETFDVDFRFMVV